MNTTYQVALPSFAPLPTSMVLHMAAAQYPASFRMTSEKLRKNVTEYLLYSVKEYQPIYQRLCDIILFLQEKVNVARAHTYHRMSQAKLNQAWLQTNVSALMNAKSTQQPGARHYSLSTQAIADYRKRNILPNIPRTFFADRCAAIYMAAMIDPRQQGFVPTTIPLGEPYYWMYMQKPPIKTGKTVTPSPISTCAYPSPGQALQVPDGTLLWSPWSSFELPGMLNASWRGSIGFYGAVTLNTLKLWNPALADPDRALIFGSVKDSDIDYHKQQTLQDLEIVYLDPRKPAPSLALLAQP